MSDRPKISVVIPAHNEAGNVSTVFEHVATAFDSLGVSGELIFVDDGSTDDTWDEALKTAERYPFARLFRHRRNLGLTEALNTAFANVRGDVVVFLPGDMESDPAMDIPLLLGKIDEGYDAVVGWRQGRHDPKVVASTVYNLASRVLFGLKLHDMNWIKAFRREVIESLPPLRSDWHRFLIHIAASQGFRVGEVKVPYKPRQVGRSKFGFWRIPISLLDVMVVKFLLTFSRKPMLFFGGLGLISALSGTLIYAYLAYLWFSRGKQQRPLFIFAGVLLLSGLLLFLVGFLAELVVSQGERITVLERRLRQESRRESR